ncbi:hypothetical protein B0A79_12680 [Flavobacterium piscis]|uniref:Uncharacterized protein n=1 Tax=Flavobacterium piscis TaxID=1114874 RepID=A0ABX2XGS6_9FLAO|nr:hypothetical protein FLP_16320 [Flavobacterium piscis]OXG04047.1 hypothetical protein B0A79_12680 [Flavobacterium piscis]
MPKIPDKSTFYSFLSKINSAKEICLNSNKWTFIKTFNCIDHHLNTKRVDFIAISNYIIKKIWQFKH